MKKFLLIGFLFFGLLTKNFSQQFLQKTPQAMHWVDSVFNTLTAEQKIGQLMVIRAHSNLGQDHINEVVHLINKYNVGGLCFFQGGPVRQANLTNYYQRIAKTPLMICIDGEWGLGMRLDSVINLPRQLMLGAVQDGSLAYEYGRLIGEQCKRMGIHVNYAPVVDVNNNPNNPVINDRSFGEDKYKVALFGSRLTKGMQDVGVMACAKHFPGHGDVDVDSHYDLPIINKSKEQLDNLELYPFKEVFNSGIGSVMVAHLYIPTIDDTKNQATSLSKKNVTDLLRSELNYEGLTFTDALEMKGVAKFYPAGKAAVQSLIAGNDMLCLPGDIEGSIKKILKAIRKKKLSWEDLNQRVKKVLLSKYHLGLNKITEIETENLVNDLNKNTNQLKKKIAEQSFTILKSDEVNTVNKSKKIAFVGIGINKENAFANKIKTEFKTDNYFFDYNKDLGTVPMMAEVIKEKYDEVIIGIHNYSRRPANNFGISNSSISLVNLLQSQMKSTTFVFGNPYAIKNFNNPSNLYLCYEDDAITQQAAFEFLIGKNAASGKLPVTISSQYQFGHNVPYHSYFPKTNPQEVGFNQQKLEKIDAIVTNAIQQKAIPGCVVLVAKNGKIILEKSYGHVTYDSTQKVTNETVYDLASVTKISATTVAIMKLYEEGKISLNSTLGEFIPWVRGTNKEKLTIQNILLHQAGLVAWIPFYKETIDSVTGKPLENIYSSVQDNQHQNRVAENLFIRNDWIDTMQHRIKTSKLADGSKYIYSDNDFIFLGKIVESITGKSLDEYVNEVFYTPLQMTTTTFKPREKISIHQIAPTEKEKQFRMQLLRGDVHDPGAAMFGGVAGHAGLFSNAYDLAQLYQMLLNEGELNGKRFFKKETINLFTAYHSAISRRGLGFDKPEKDNAFRKEPYPTLSASSKTFGHTGFTGTCVWADPQENLLYIFLSNRVNPEGGENTKLLKMNVRSNIHETIYEALKKD